MHGSPSTPSALSICSTARLSRRLRRLARQRWPKTRFIEKLHTRGSKPAQQAWEEQRVYCCWRMPTCSLGSVGHHGRRWRHWRRNIASVESHLIFIKRHWAPQDHLHLGSVDQIDVFTLVNQDSFH